jgi:hypothetical protein
MKCPHCNVEMMPEKKDLSVGQDPKGHWNLKVIGCPSDDCKRLSLYLERYTYEYNGSIRVPIKAETILVYPNTHGRDPLPNEVPKKYAEEYNEACSVLRNSPKASATLSRRLLQTLLREEAGIHHSDLASEIDEVIERGDLPGRMKESIEAIRRIGNFGAHPIKSKNTAEIVDVEVGEAEWTLDVLESLFDFYFVQPALIKKKKEALNQKLKDAGKPEMK